MKLILAFCFLLLLYGLFSTRQPRRRESGSSRPGVDGESESTTGHELSTGATIDGTWKPWQPTEKPLPEDNNQHNRQP